jgi:hypothetical protein
MSANRFDELAGQLHGARVPGVVLTALIAFAIAAAWLFWVGEPIFVMDDAYIVQHAVQSMLAGQEDTRFGGSPLNGATSLAHVFCVWLFSLVMPVAWAQFGVATLAWVAWLVGVHAYAQRHRLSSVLCCAVLLFAAVSAFAFYQAFNGLETGLAMAACMCLIVCFDRAKAVTPCAYILVGLLPFIRPELTLLAGLLLLRQFVVLGPAGMPWRAWLCMVVPALLMAGFSWHWGGDWLPGTVSAKTYFFAEGCAPIGKRWGRFTEGLAGVLPGLGFGLGLVGFVGLLRLRLRWVLVLFVVGFLLAYLLRFPGAVTHNHFRYLHLLLPMLVAGWVAWLGATQRVSPLILALPLVACMVLSIPNALDEVAIARGAIRHTRVELDGVTRWVNERLPRDAVVLVHDAGYISIRGSHRLVDLVGLKTPWAAQVHKRLTWTQCSRATPAVSEIAGMARATHFVVLTSWDQAMGLSNSLRSQGWRLDRVDQERGDSAFRVYRLDPPPDGFGSPAR